MNHQLQHFLIVLLFITTTLIAQEGQKRVLVRNFVSATLDSSEIITVTNFFANELRQFPEYRVISFDEVTALADQYGSTITLDCDDDQCLEAIAGAIDAPFIVKGEINVVGSRYIVNMSMLDVVKATTIISVSEVFGSIDEIVDQLPKLASGFSHLEGGERLLHLAENGDALAELYVGLCNLFKDLGSEGIPSQEFLFDELGIDSTENNEYYLYFTDLLNDTLYIGSFENGLDMLTRSANSGNTSSMAMLGAIYSDGWPEHITTDYSKGFYWFTLAANNGNESAMINLGKMYKYGDGVTQDSIEAEQWFRDGTRTLLQSAENDNLDAMVKLASIYRWDTRDSNRAIHWYKKAAESGSVRAMSALGSIYNGENDSESFRWYLEAAEHGDVKAMTSLGHNYSLGKGTVEDDAEAVRWFRKAALEGDAYGMDRLAWMYQHGDGVTKNYSEAIYWYREAIRNGEVSSMTRLAFMYHWGYGVSQDIETANDWYRKAAEAGDRRGQSYCDRNGIDWLIEL